MPQQTIYEVAAFEKCPNCGVDERVLGHCHLRLHIVKELHMRGDPEFTLIGWNCGNLLFGTMVHQSSRESTHWMGPLPQPSHHHVLIANLCGREVSSRELGGLEVKVISYREQLMREQERIRRRESVREVK